MTALTGAEAEDRVQAGRWPLKPKLGNKSHAPEWMENHFFEWLWSPTPELLSSNCTAEPHFFFQHIAKTAGTSWGHDMLNLTSPSSPLKSCVHPHLTGPNSGYATLSRALNTAKRRASAGSCGSAHVEKHCNTYNREYALHTNLMLFFDRGLPAPRLILLLRSPFEHVRSMYGHCSATGQMRDRENRSRLITIEEWLHFFSRRTTRDFFAGMHECYYNPVEYQTSSLTLPYVGEARVITPAAQLQVLEVLKNAFLVAVVEHYSAGLCLLTHLLRPGVTHECGKGASKQLTHDNHGARSSEVALSGEAVALISQMTRADQVTYAAALSRFFADAVSSGLGDLLTPKLAYMTEPCNVQKQPPALVNAAGCR